MFLALGLSTASSVLSGVSGRNKAAAQQILAEANAYSENKARESQNLLNMQAANNQRSQLARQQKSMIQQADYIFSAAAENLARAQAYSVGLQFEQSVANEETMGRIAADAAVRGAVGSTTNDLVAMTARLQQEKQAINAQQQAGYIAADMTAQATSSIEAAMNARDMSFVSDQRDEGKTFAPMQVNQGNIFTDMLGGALKGMASMGTEGLSNLFASNPGVKSIVTPQNKKFGKF